MPEDKFDKMPKCSECESLKTITRCIKDQKGWTKSKVCVADYHLARDKHIKREEAYVFTDRYTVKMN